VVLFFHSFLRLPNSLYLSYLFHPLPLLLPFPSFSLATYSLVSLSLSALLSPVTHEGSALTGVNAVIRRIKELKAVTKKGEREGGREERVS